MSGKWIVRRDTGRPWMAGMMLTAIRTLPVNPDDDPDGVWLVLAICPRCHATLIADGAHVFGDQQEAHMRWHAATDHPIPDDVQAATGDGGEAAQIDAKPFGGPRTPGNTRSDADGDAGAAE